MAKQTDAERYNWKNLTPAEKLVQKTAGSGWTCSWFAQFEFRLFLVAVKLAARVLYLERKLREVKKTKLDSVTEREFCSFKKSGEYL